VLQRKVLLSAAPIAVDDTGVTTNEDSAVTVSVLANDSDPDGDTLTISSFDQPGSGTVTQSVDDLTYTPNQDFNGSESFGYTIGDGNGGTATAYVYVNVASVNDIPTANDDSLTTDEDTSISIDVLSNDTDPDSDTLTLQSFTTATDGSVQDDGSGWITYTPNPDFNDSDSFGYTIDDGNGGTSSATVNITVNSVNDFPVAVDDTGVTTNEDTAVTVSVLANDSDPDGDTLTISTFDQPGSGTVTQSVDDLTYTPNQDFNGSDSFGYTIDDGNGGTATAYVYVNVASVNDIPTAINDSVTTGAIVNCRVLRMFQAASSCRVPSMNCRP